MNRKKQNDPIYYFKESSEEISKNKNKTNYNYFQKTSKKAEYKTFFPNEQKIESYKTKSKKASDKASTKETINQPQISKAQNKNNNINNNDINKTPKRIKRKISNESNKKEKENNIKNKNDSSNKKSVYEDEEEIEDDLVTSFEKKPSELKSPDTISEDSFTSSYENKEKEEKDINDNNNIDNIKEKEKEKDKNKNKELKKKIITNKEKYISKNIKDLKEKINNNIIILNKPKITVNKTPRELGIKSDKEDEIINIEKEKIKCDIKIDNNNDKENKETIPYIPVNQRKKEDSKINEESNISYKEPETKINKNDKLCLTNVKAVKQKKFFIQTEDKKNGYKKKYINVNNNKNKNTSTNTNTNFNTTSKINIHTNNNSRINNNKNNNINISHTIETKKDLKNINNNNIKNKNNQLENKKLNNISYNLNKNIKEFFQKKKHVIMNKIPNNKPDLKIESNNINKEKKQNTKTLSRNISFNNNSKKIIYAQKKLISSTHKKNQEKNEINGDINIIEEHINKSNPTQFKKKIIELYNNNVNYENNTLNLEQNLKNSYKFFEDNNFIKQTGRYSINNKEPQSNNISNNLILNGVHQNLYIHQNNCNSNDFNINEPLKSLKNLQFINFNSLDNKSFTPNNFINNNNYNNLNLSNSSSEINNLNNIYLQNLYQYNFNSNKNPNNINNNSNSTQNFFSINFEDLIILQEYLQEMLISLSKNKPIFNECFEFWNYYYNSTLLSQLDKIFLNKVDSIEVINSIYYSLMSIMLCYDYSFEHDLFIKVIIPLMELLKLNYKNLIHICEYILTKISKECITNIWVLKLANRVNESNYNDYSQQILKDYNMTLIEKISYNTNIILQNLRFLLKNYKSNKNAILTSLFKKIREKSYEEINIFFRENILRISNLNGSILGSIFLLKNRNFRPVPPPYVRTKNSKEYSLVLDLDETLIHFKPHTNGEEAGTLRVRPGISEFLEEVGKYYELIVFTTATQEYADILIDAIEEDKIYFEHRLYREHATIVDNDFVKDLSRIGRPLDKIIIVDNMPQNFRLQKENGIIIKAFWGEDRNDIALFELIHILINIAKEGGDIRKSLVKFKDQIVKKVTSCFSKSEES